MNYPSPAHTPTHPKQHIVEFHEVFLTPSYLAVVMEYVNGTNLQHYLEVRVCVLGGRVCVCVCVCVLGGPESVGGGEWGGRGACVGRGVCVWGVVGGVIFMIK